MENILKFVNHCFLQRIVFNYLHFDNWNLQYYNPFYIFDRFFFSVDKTHTACEIDKLHQNFQ